MKMGGVLWRNWVMMRIPSACSLRSLSVRSVEEYQGKEQTLDLIVTLKLLSSSTSPSKSAFCFIWPGHNQNIITTRSHQGDII